MSQSGNSPKDVSELDADRECAAALKALQEAAWRLRIASYTLEEEHRAAPLLIQQGIELGACIAIADHLATQIDAIGTQTRRLRKRARNI